MAEITCPTNCAQALPDVAFDACTPVYKYGEIESIVFGLPGQPLTLGDAAEFTTRFAAATAEPTKLVRLFGAGDMPAGSGEPLRLSSRYIVQGPKDRTINFTVWDLNDTNREFARRVDKCGGKFIVWPVTKGGDMFGGEDFNDGIEVNVTANEIIPRGDKEVQSLEFTLSWSGNMPERKTSVIS